MIRAQHKPQLRNQPASDGTTLPAFKPVALPALTAAMRSAYREPARKDSIDFPTMLRIDAMLERNQN